MTEQETKESIRGHFVETFGEDLAAAIERAAESHITPYNANNRGSDPFKWALLITIGYQCFEVDAYREFHGITGATYEQIRDWIKEHGDLASHDGDFDSVAAFCGLYGQYMPTEEAVAE